MSTFMRSQLEAICVILFFTLPYHVAKAEETRPEEFIRWHCWLASDELPTINCVQEERFERSGTGPADTKLFDRQTYLRDLFAPGAPRNVARLVRSDPAAYGDKLWRIPLYGPAFDMENVKSLASSVMCGKDTRCTVKFEGP